MMERDRGKPLENTNERSSERVPSRHIPRPLAEQDLTNARGRASRELLGWAIEGKASIGVGSYGLQVRLVQRALNEWIAEDPKRRGPYVPENGRFELPTARAVRRFQKGCGLEEDGTAGAKTLSRLGVDYVTPPSPPKRELSRHPDETSTFRYAIQDIYQVEGGLSDHDDDRGGRTNMGITSSTLSYLRESGNFPKGTRLPSRVDDLDREDSRAIYRNFWEKSGAPYLPAGLALMHFDAAVNHSPTIARRMLESALVACGHEPYFGVARNLSPRQEAEVIRKFSEIRGHLYDGLCRYDESQKSFEQGWENRLSFITTQSLRRAT